MGPWSNTFAWRPISLRSTQQHGYDLLARFSASWTAARNFSSLNGLMNKATMPICAIAPFSMWDGAIMPHISPRQVGRVVDLGLMDLSLTRDGGPARRRRAAKCEPNHSLACFLADTNPRG